MASIGRLLRTNRNFCWILASVAATIVAEVLVLGGLLADVYERSGSALQTILVTTVTMLTAVVLGPFSGVFADRVPRKWMLAGANWMRALIIGGFYLLIQAELFAGWQVYLIAFFYMAGATIRQPARLSIIPQIIAVEDLVLANSMMKAVFLAGAAFAFWLVGILMLNFGLGLVTLIAAACFVLGGLLVTPISIPDAPTPTNSAETPSIWQSIGEGYDALKGHQVARPLVIMEAMESIPQGIWTYGLLLVFMERALGGNAADWGVMNSMYQVGLLGGVFIALFITQFINRRAGWVIIADTIFTALIAVPFVFSGSPRAAIALYALIAVPQAIRDAAQDSVLQSSVDNTVLGRIYALRGAASQFTGLFASLLFAWLADFADIRLLFGIGAGIFVLVAFYAYANQSLRQSRIEDRETQPALPRS